VRLFVPCFVKNPKIDAIRGKVRDLNRAADGDFLWYFSESYGENDCSGGATGVYKCWLGAPELIKTDGKYE
jgi:hypothetical protein